MSKLKRTLLAALCVLPSACSVGTDADSPSAVEQRAGAVTGCTNPTNGMVITANTTLCAGTFAMVTAAGAAAVTVAANNVQVTCNGTRLVGPGPVGPGASPNVAFSIVGRSGVTLLGCSANAFQYGAVVKNSSAITFQSTHFDDNYTDATQGWVQDAVQGGGIRFDNVTGSAIKDSSVERNWNGVELRGGSGNLVNNVTGDHCTNWGVLVAASNNNTVSNSNFSWALRSGPFQQLSYPNAWYGMITVDSAGIVIDAGATGNLIQNNNVQYGGDGIFIRSIIGACAAGNQLVGNNTSFSPNNGIESWCDNGTFKSNTSSSCNYGIWLGGSDNSTVVGNTASSNKVDGISTQVAEDRHSIYQDNTLAGNARAGLFLVGANDQNSNPPSPEDSRVWNSSNLIVQRNTFSGNGSYDVYVGYSRQVALASNSLTASKVFTETATTADVFTLGNFTNAAGRTPPTAALVRPSTVRAGTASTFDASGSRLSSSGGTLAFNWLIQAAGSLFGNALPSPFFGGSGGASKSYSFASPGFYDVDVIVTDGLLGSVATQNIAVVPGGTRVGDASSSWTYQCQTGDNCGATTFVDDPAGIEGSAVHVSTGAAFDFAMVTPPAKNLGLNASGKSKLGFFVKANNQSPVGWQAGPVIVLGSPSGTITYTPPQLLLPTTVAAGWSFIEVPLAGGNGWTVTNGGGSLSQVNWVEIHADTWDAGFDIWVDALSFY
jgi:parallel beta-helix repeat protein